MGDSKIPPTSRPHDDDPVIRVRRIHRRDLNRVWEFLKLVFRDVNRETVEYQRPRSKRRFLEVYEEEGVEQLLFEVAAEDMTEIVGYAECAFEITGSDNWMNERYFAKHDMRPLFVEELAVHPSYQGRGIGGFLLEQLEHLARVRGCTHLVLEVAENNMNALTFYRARTFYKLDAAIFLAKKVAAEEELLPPRRLKKKTKNGVAAAPAAAKGRAAKRKAAEPEKKVEAAVKKASRDGAASGPKPRAPAEPKPAPRRKKSAPPAPPVPTPSAAAREAAHLANEETLTMGQPAELIARPISVRG